MVLREQNLGLFGLNYHVGLAADSGCIHRTRHVLIIVEWRAARTLTRAVPKRTRFLLWNFIIAVHLSNLLNQGWVVCSLVAAIRFVIRLFITQLWLFMDRSVIQLNFTLFCTLHNKLLAQSI